MEKKRSYRTNWCIILSSLVCLIVWIQFFVLPSHPLLQLNFNDLNGEDSKMEAFNTGTQKSSHKSNYNKSNSKKVISGIEQYVIVPGVNLVNKVDIKNKQYTKTIRNTNANTDTDMKSVSSSSSSSNHLSAAHIGAVLPYKNRLKNKGNLIKQDLKVYMNPEWSPARPGRELGESHWEPTATTSIPSGGFPRHVNLAYEYTLKKLRMNPLVDRNFNPSSILNMGNMTMERAMLYMSQQPACTNKPIFMTMASIGSELYWQLVETFVYSLTKFDMIQCSLVICMSDLNCMNMCKNNDFPCFLWDFRTNYPQVPKTEKVTMMEQIAYLKLRHVPRVLELGIDIFMLDLDVGFLASPQPFIDVFYDPDNSHVDILVQEDMIFIMNRTKAGWKQWYTEPLPNIGLFLVRGNSKTVKTFDNAWDNYNKYAEKRIRGNPGKDQNHVLGSMRVHRARSGLRYAYFENNTAVLLDKLYTWQHNRSVELGALAAENILFGQKTVAVHTTCYEQTVKIWALKAANAYWNPRYYDPYRRTITKLIYYKNKEQMEDELRALIWLGVVTNRSVIVANAVGDMSDKQRQSLQDNYDIQSIWPDEAIPSGVRPVNYICPGGFMQHYVDKTVGNGAAPMWPGFRLVKTIPKKISFSTYGIELLEAGFYWRCNRHYATPPEPTVVTLNKGASLQDIRVKLNAIGIKEQPRVVIHIYDDEMNGNINMDIDKGNDTECIRQKQALYEWSTDPSGIGVTITKRTKDAWNVHPTTALPTTTNLDILDGKRHVETNRHATYMRDIKGGVRMCKNVFGPLGGNRTCFRKCR